MITKQKRGEKHFDIDLIDIKVEDINGNSFIMTVAGNQDLYWIPERRKDKPRDYSPITFEFDNSDPFLYETLCEIFADIEKNDNKYSPSLKDNVFTFISEDYPEEDANILKITKEKDKFIIDFIRTEGQTIWGQMKRGSIICFCNSGSRVPKIEQIFMLKFNELAYFNNEIEMVE